MMRPCRWMAPRSGIFSASAVSWVASTILKVPNFRGFLRFSID